MPVFNEPPSSRENGPQREVCKTIGGYVAMIGDVIEINGIWEWPINNSDDQQPSRIRRRATGEKREHFTMIREAII